MFIFTETFPHTSFAKLIISVPSTFYGFHLKILHYSFRQVNSEQISATRETDFASFLNSEWADTGHASYRNFYPKLVMKVNS